MKLWKEQQQNYPPRCNTPPQWMTASDSVEAKECYHHEYDPPQINWSTCILSMTEAYSGTDSVNSYLQRPGPEPDQMAPFLSKQVFENSDLKRDGRRIPII